MQSIKVVQSPRSVMVLLRNPNYYSKRPIKKRLEAVGHKEGLFFHRAMSEKEVNDVILDAFEDLGIRGFR